MNLHLLSPEILLHIITRLPDLDTLYNILRASSRSWRLFNEQGLAIIEAILSNDSLLPQQIKELLRALILARSSAFPFQTLNDFQQKFLQGILTGPNRKGHPQSYDPRLQEPGSCRTVSRCLPFHHLDRTPHLPPHACVFECVSLTCTGPVSRRTTLSRERISTRPYAWLRPKEHQTSGARMRRHAGRDA